MKRTLPAMTALTLALGGYASAFAQTTAHATAWNGVPFAGPTAPESPSTLPDTPVERWRQIPYSTTQDAGYQISLASREAARLFYRTVFASSNNVASGWSGDLSTCTAGDTHSDYKAATLRRINWFRAMAGVPASIGLDSTYNRKAQQTALMMSAQGALSHYPDSAWACYTAEGAEGARNSNLSLGQAGADSVANGYIRDQGSNNAPVGHRRWLLYPQTKIMGVGDVTPSAANTLSANAVWVFDGNSGATRPTVRDDFVAWPPAGFVPYTTVYPRWSLAYPGADFSGASVSMTENGRALATRLETLQNGYGEPTLVWLPGTYTDGSSWSRPSADTVYQVTVSNVRVGGQTRSFSYSVTVFDPDVPGTDTPNLQPTGATTLVAGQTGSYQFTGSNAATEFQWRAITLAPYALDEGAEGSTTAFVANTSTGYSPIATDISASGGRSFHLAHTTGTDQTLQLQSAFVPSGSATLSFASRLGLSSANQVALVEVSTDEGSNWQEIYRQAGQQSGTTSNFGESSFNSKSVSLAAFADQSVLLRLRYAYVGGSFYPQSSRGIGWYIDDIRLSGVEAIASASTPAPAASTSGFNFTASGGSQVLLQVRPGMYGYYDGWSKALRVAVAGTVSSTDCLFNWAERMVTDLLWPSASTQTTGRPPFSAYRYYTGTQSYLGVSALDQHVYFQQGTQSLDLGLESFWVGEAGCR